MPAEAKTKEGRRVSQFSVFMANKCGRLLEIVRLFGEAGTHIVALTIVDTTDSAIARLVVTDPDAARDVLEEHGIEYTECTLVVVEVSSAAEDLHKILRSLLMAEINIFFTYAFFIQPRGKSAIALHVDDHDIASNVLNQAGLTLLTQNDISR
ncbi:MAG: acetolactate synthase [Verrucomicrobiota bacterium]